MTHAFHELFFKNFFKLFTAFLILAMFMYILSPFVLPVVLGGILAMALSPTMNTFIKRGWSKKKALWVLSAIIFFAGALPSALFFARGAKIISQFLSEQSITTLTSNIQDRVYAFLDNMAELYSIDHVLVHEKFQAVINNIGTFFLKTSSDLLSQIPDLILAGVISVLSFYFFLIKEDEIRKLFDRYFYFTRLNSERFVSLLKSSCREVFFSNVLTGIIQASIVSLGALACGIGDFYITFIFTFIFSFVPIIGAAPMAFVLALVAFADSRVGAGITMSIIGGVTGLADNVIRPYLASMGEVEVSPFIGLLAVVGGVIVMGLPGLFVGPLIASLVYGALPIIFDEYFPKEQPIDKILE
jgi:predicted PurR-regulated permease PerM